MSDVNMGKIKALYADMVSIEQNVSSIEKRMTGNLRVLERIAAQRTSEKTQPKHQNLVASLKTIVMLASIAFGAGFSLKPGSNIALVFAGIPVGMGVLWIVLSHFEEKRDGGTVGAEIRSNPASETKQLWTEDEFHRVALKTKLFEPHGRSVLGCANKWRSSKNCCDEKANIPRAAHERPKQV